jgi:hypothetical protein
MARGTQNTTPQIKQVDSNEVREWANKTGWRDELNRPVADRGRMPSGLIDAYNKANARYNKEYQPIPRPVRADYREQAEQQRASKATARASRSNTQADSGNTTRSNAKESAPAPAPVAAAPVSTDSDGVQSLQDVIAMLTAAQNKKGGRQAVVTIQTLITV